MRNISNQILFMVLVTLLTIAGLGYMDLRSNYLQGQSTLFKTNLLETAEGDCVGVPERGEETDLQKLAYGWGIYNALTPYGWKPYVDQRYFLDFPFGSLLSVDKYCIPISSTTIFESL